MNKTRKNKYLRKNRRISKKNKNKKIRKVQSGGEPGNTAVHGKKNPIAIGTGEAALPTNRVLSGNAQPLGRTRKPLTQEEFKKKLEKERAEAAATEKAAAQAAATEKAAAQAETEKAAAPVEARQVQPLPGQFGQFVPGGQYGPFGQFAPGGPFGQGRQFGQFGQGGRYRQQYNTGHGFGGSMNDTAAAVTTASTPPPDTVTTASHTGNDKKPTNESQSDAAIAKMQQDAIDLSKTKENPAFYFQHYLKKQKHML
jgi:hypothetical protein